MKSKRYLFLIMSSLLLASCDKIGERIENYDFFGFDRANEGIKQSEEKIKAAQTYHKLSGHEVQNHYHSPNILENY